MRYGKGEGFSVVFVSLRVGLVFLYTRTRGLIYTEPGEVINGIEAGPSLKTT